MNYLTVKKQKGIFLVEVLVASVVVAIGLLAVGLLQGDFMQSSGENKTKSEALFLAEKKIESLRNNIIKTGVGGYDAIPNSATAVTDSVTGTNAVYTRSWVINEGGTANLKNVSVQVKWGDASDERVNVVTEMAFIDPLKSSVYMALDGSGIGAVPNPRQNASEDVNAASENVVGTDLAITDLDTRIDNGAAGVDSQLQVLLPGLPGETGTNLILSQVASGSQFYTATHAALSAVIEAGVIAVFLCDDNGAEQGTCSHIQNHFGGVVHRMQGVVYSTSGLDLSARYVAWSSSETHACYNGAVTTNTDASGNVISERPYECVYAGNCNATASGVGGCFADNVVSDDQINARKVGPGGEYGNSGLLGIGASGGSREQVCFLENTAAESSILLAAASDLPLNENYLYAVSRRFYVTRRVEKNDTIRDHKNEGINRSYTNHNYFIVDRGTGPQTKKDCREQAIDIHAKVLAPREISRVLNEGVANTVPVESAYAGGAGEAITLTGTVSGNATNLGLFIEETGACYLNNNQAAIGVAATAYACVIGSSAGGVADIIGSSNEFGAGRSLAAFVTCNTASLCAWTGNFTTALPN